MSQQPSVLTINWIGLFYQECDVGDLRCRARNVRIYRCKMSRRLTCRKQNKSTCQ